MTNRALQLLQERQAPLMRLPQTTAADDEEMPERQTFDGNHLARMARRMAAALQRLTPDTTRAVMLTCPGETPEQLLAWLAITGSGREVLLRHDMPNDADTIGAIICPPDEKEQFQELARRHGIKLATLGGHWEGSFFMLQMVQQAAQSQPWPDACPGLTRLAGDEQTISLETLLNSAAGLARENGLQDTPALLLSLPALRSVAMLTTALAALLFADVPLYWLPCAQRRQALKSQPSLPEGVLIISDPAFADMLTGTSTGNRLLRQARGCMTVNEKDFRLSS